eukprot:Phypoly_transcript_00446.p1 GENE.Phypoly_transcript_00446~~Phypoly_transcript_00446.p1  ORF type:complete len:1333 (+),score=184.90 Phypoly_transcript_00446:94-4092(+)
MASLPSFLLFFLLATCAFTCAFGSLDLLGRYEVLRSDDFERGVSRTYNLIRDLRESKTYHVHPSSLKGFANIRSGTTVRVRGGSIVERHESSGMITHGEIHVEKYEVLGNSPTQNSTAMQFRRMVMLLINLGKYDLQCTPASMKDLINGADGWYNGIIGLTERNTGSVITYSNRLFESHTIDVYGPFDVDYDDTCNPDKWANTAMDAARLQGVDISAYQHRVFALPGVGELYSTCGWHGLGNVGCAVCNAWVADCTTVEVFLHELGHNLGLGHAGSNWNQDGKLVEYGDPTSVMGNAWWSTNNDVTWYNLPETDYLMRGAMEVLKVTESGDYRIAAFDVLPLNVKHPQGIKVEHPETGHLFYFSFHSNETVYFAKQIVVHEFAGQGATCYIIRSLPLGEVFTDKLNRIAVSPIEYTGDTYTLRVTYGCVVQPTYHALFMHSKSESYEVTRRGGALPISEGETALFTLQLFNTDSPLCTPTTYNFSAASTPSWPVTFSPPVLYLVPGQNCSVTISVQIPSGTASGNYPIDIKGAASSGFLATDHDISVTLNTTLGPLECTHKTPSLRIVGGDILGTAIVYTLQIGNDDGFGCETTEFVVTIDLPSQLIWDYKSKEISLAPGRYEEILLKFTLEQDAFNKNFSVNVTSPHHVTSTIYQDIPPMITSACVHHTPLLQILEANLNMETRSADSVLVSVTNRDVVACEGSVFQFSVLEAPPSQFVRISLYPSSMYLLPGQVGYFYIMVAVPIFQMQTNLSIPVGAERVLGGNFYFDSTSYLSLSLTPPPCVLSNLGAYSWCDVESDLADGWVQCAGLIQDMDSWNCPNINLRVQALAPPGWHADFEQGQIMQYNPGNETWYWVNFTVPLDLEPGYYNFTFYGGEVQDESLHPFATAPYWVNTCNKTQLLLTPSAPAPPPAAQGATVILTVNVKNQNSMFCDAVLAVLAAETGKEMAGLVTVAFSRNTFILAHSGATNDNANVDVAFTVNRTGILPLNQSDTTRTFTFNLTATNKHNMTFYMTKLAINLTVDLTCAQNPPLVLISPILGQISAPGDYAEGNYTVSVTNTDTENCSSTQFFTAFSTPDLFFPPVTVNAILAPNETFVTNITLGVSDNVPPGVYSVTALTSDGTSATHSISATSNYTIGCPVPRPIFNLTAVQFTPFLHTKTAVQLAWSACENPLWCCCPCTWEIYRDGVKIGISTGSNYTDVDRPAGSHNNYTAITIDKRGIRSPTTDTCTLSVEVSVLPPDLTNLYYFIGLVIGSTVWTFGCAFLVVMFRKSLQDKINRNVDETALLLSENGDIRSAKDEEDEMRQEVWTEADSRVSSDAGDDENEEL